MAGAKGEKMARVLVLLLSVALLTPSVVRADSVPAPATGQRVRLTAPAALSKPLVGTLADVEPGAVYLEVDGFSTPVRVPREFVTKWEESRGYHTQVGRIARRGFFIGAAAGLALALFSPDGYDLEEEILYLGVPAVLGGLGAGLGALAGLSKVERWEEVEPAPLRVGVLPVPGGVGLSVQWSFSGRSSAAR